MARLVLGLLLLSISLPVAYSSCQISGNQAACTITSYDDFATLPSSSEVNQITIFFWSTFTNVTLTKEIFPSLPNIQGLGLNLDQVTSLSSGLFENLPNLEVLEFYAPNRNSGVDSLVTGLLQGLPKLQRLRILNIGDISIQQDVFGDTSMPALKYMEISENMLREIPVNMFDKTPNLEILDLHGNRLRLRDSMFSELSNLLTLGLGGNGFTDLSPPGLFTGLSSLKVLNLTHNNLFSVDDNVFKPLTKLEELLLQHNRLTVLQENTFTGLQNLITLLLYKNDIFSLHDRTFAPLVNLDRLDISYNGVSSFSITRLGGLQKVTWLDLRKNSLGELVDDMFYTLPLLKFLHLNTNMLLTIQPSAFRGLPSLRFLQLDDNFLDGVPAEVLRHWTSLTYLGLADNPWDCDCEHIDLLKYINRQIDQAAKNGTAFDLEGASKVKCSTPEKYKDFTLVDVIFSTDNIIPYCDALANNGTLNYTTISPPTSSDVTPATPLTTLSTATQGTITTSVQTTVTIIPTNPTPGRNLTTAIQPDTTPPGLDGADKLAIILACVAVFLLALIAMVVFLWCRHKRKNRWKPEFPITNNIDMTPRSPVEQEPTFTSQYWDSELGAAENIWDKGTEERHAPQRATDNGPSTSHGATANGHLGLSRADRNNSDNSKSSNSSQEPDEYNQLISYHQQPNGARPQPRPPKPMHPLPRQQQQQYNQLQPLSVNLLQQRHQYLDLISDEDAARNDRISPRPRHHSPPIILDPPPRSGRTPSPARLPQRYVEPPNRSPLQLPKRVSPQVESSDTDQDDQGFDIQDFQDVSSPTLLIPVHKDDDDIPQVTLTPPTPASASDGRTRCNTSGYHSDTELPTPTRTLAPQSERNNNSMDSLNTQRRTKSDPKTDATNNEGSPPNAGPYISEPMFF